MDKDEARKKIEQHLHEAEEALAKAQKVADEANVSFSWNGPTYGMGGNYYPKIWESSSCYEEDDAHGWKSSSHYC